MMSGCDAKFIILVVPQQERERELQHFVNEKDCFESLANINREKSLQQDE